MGKLKEAEPGYTIVAISGDNRKRHFGQPMEPYLHTCPATRDLRLNEIKKLEKVCKKCLMRRKCKPRHVEMTSFTDPLVIVPTVSGYRLDKSKCRITRGSAITGLYNAQ